MTSVTLPDSVVIFGTRINVHVNEVCYGELSNLTESRNHTGSGKTGFLVWISSYCIACFINKIKK